jgi:transitional endoplasmic reticulum ATPase
MDRNSLKEDIFGGGSPIGGDMLTELIGLLNVGGGMKGTRITGDEVKFHDGTDIILPNGMTYQRAFNILDRMHRDSETVITWNETFNYRPDDGAYATAQVIRDRYGMSFGEVTYSMWGANPPETKTITTSYGVKEQVPWGHISIPSLPGLEMYLSYNRHRDYGLVFQINAEGPKKYKDEVKAFFAAIEQYLKTSSIYRGQAVVGSDELEFLDLSNFKANEIVFSSHASALMENTVWSPIRNAALLREEGVPLKRAVLLHGPYGTGKSSAGLITAQIAIQNGWTFLSARAGRDEVEDVLRTARLYGPAVVFIEDIDVEASTAEDDEVTALLDAFDGITAKGAELIVVMTTNHLERIHKGMLRPGRLDGIVEIASLDRVGVEQLIKAVVPAEKLDLNTNFDTVYGAMDGFFPAFVREALDRAKIHAINRLQSRQYTLNTEDIVAAAETLNEQLKALHDAEEGERRPTMDTVVGDIVGRTIHGSQLIRNSGGDFLLSVPGLNGLATATH